MSHRHSRNPVSKWLFRFDCNWLIILINSLLLSGLTVAIAPTSVESSQQFEVLSPEADLAVAQSMISTAESLFLKGTKASQQKAVQNFLEASKILNLLGRSHEEAYILSVIGYIYYYKLNDLQKALEFYSNAWKLYQNFEDFIGKAGVLGHLGLIHARLGNKEQSLSFYNQALLQYQIEGDEENKATTFYNMGRAYEDFYEREKALNQFNQALTLYQKLKNYGGIARTFNSIGRIHYKLNNHQKALEFFEQALPIYKKLDIQEEVAEVLKNIGFVYNSINKQQQALSSFKEALLIQQKVGNKKGQADCFHGIGLTYNSIGDRQKALGAYSQALVLKSEIEDREGKATTLQSMALIYDTVGNKSEALKLLYQSLAIAESIQGLSRLEKKAKAFSSIGLVYRTLNEWNKSLDNLNQALHHQQELGLRKDQSYTLNLIASVHYDMGEWDKALEHHKKALILSRLTIDQYAEAQSLFNMGTVYQATNNLDKAIELYDQSLIIRRKIGDQQGEAAILVSFGWIYLSQKKPEKAIDAFERSLKLNQAVSYQNGKSENLVSIGYVYYLQQKYHHANKLYQQALDIKRTLGDRDGEAQILFAVALAEQSQGNLYVALDRVDSAINFVENLRGKIHSKDSKIAYFATVQSYYQLKINLLMQLHQQQPQKGYDIQAMETSERARARSLNELLTESRADIRKGVRKDLLEEEENLQWKLIAAEKQLIQLSGNPNTQAQAVKVQQELKELYQQQSQLKDKIRRESPEYAKLKYPEPLKLQDIQKHLDQDTLLLQYSLGEERSYLWVVSKTGMTSYTLPGRKVIEQAAQRFREILEDPGVKLLSVTRENAQGNTVAAAANELSQLILKPATAQLGNKRLVVVADGALHHVPFAALSHPNLSGKSYTPLIVTNEIVNLPSASTIAILRDTILKRTKPARKTLALLADPVFSKDDDDRVLPAPNQTALTRTPLTSVASPISLTQAAFTRMTRNAERSGWKRLEHTETEGKAILAKVPDSEENAVFGFDANYRWMTSPALKQYRYIHLATHGFFDEKNPELSGLLLSMVNRQGQPQDRGFLRIGDLFNLDFAADLVVLSACQTGLGENIRGEGIVGMTRGLMYAGTPRVVTSLWNVDDEATAMLMEQFYTAMLKQGKPPAAALRASQLAMWQQGKNPYLWAAFTLQGEWR
ncbi:MAG: tetratricopeptide repeat protein [Leptolyngbyaceae cyanobacterium bins.302]|nr:tetratricopeptide repeat protein [Leptolyngbyaceae cyanobacterium bins.302]